ncbi:hypothetical protein [Tenacibaculum halocynthiae]|uniref:hypothetical protein n=1 Tax=Tenacibaculum halocynthiae TaxID=1254437 RepID=UPI003D64CFA3
MKYINILKKLNRVLIVTTIVMYLTIYFGLLIQMVLGVYQLLTAFILLFYIKKITSKDKYKLLIYWGAVLLYGMGWLVSFDISLGNYVGVIFYIILPMIIALYFSYFLESLRTKNK